ncbi:MAG: PilZ domain-containing protein [Elusimicrobiota bacterium]|jgi:hypothetical protein
MSEKRRHPRFPVDITMEVRTKSRVVGKGVGRILDLSVGGMAIKTDTEIEEGSSLFLKINIPLEIRGEVRHMRSSVVGGLHRYGVRFHRIGFVSPEAAKPEHHVTAKFRRKS